MSFNGQVHVSRITVYPVKSLDGIDVPQAKVLPSGALEHDRRWAIIDGHRNFVNAKHRSRIHDLSAEFRLEFEEISVEVRGQGNSTSWSLSHETEEFAAWLCEFFGFQVQLIENTEVGNPDDLQAPGPTIISTQTLREVSSWFGWPVDQTRRRFRANLEVEATVPFWEDHLYGARGDTIRFRVGDVILEGSNPCARCVVPSRDPDTGAIHPGFAAEFAKRREQTLPAWVVRSRFDHFYRLAVNTRPACNGGWISVGDAVELL